MQLTHEVLALQLSEPFVSAKGGTTEIRQILVKINWNKFIGFGTVILAKSDGAFENSAFEGLARCSEILKDATPFQLETIMNQIEQAIPGLFAVHSAIDMCIHDLLAKTSSLPLNQYWGLQGITLPHSGISLGIMEANELLDQAKSFSHWPILKLKMSAGTSLSIVTELRKIYSGRIWVDGNGTWDVDAAINAANVLWKSGVELFEQPIPAGTPELLKVVQDRTPLKVVADEDCTGPQDVIRLAACVKVINIKLFKCGGLRRALEMIRLAKRAGLGIMLGCKTESVLGISAIAQLAGLADFLDIDGHFDVVNDPFLGLEISNGSVKLPDFPGIGALPRSLCSL